MAVRKLITIILSGIVICLIAALSVGATGDIARLQLTQAYYEAPEITAYIELANQSGEPQSNIKPEQISALLGGTAIPVKDLRTFSDLDQGVAYVFLADLSNNISDVQFAQMRKMFNSLIDNMNKQDRAAILTTSNEVKNIQDFSGDKKLLKSRISGLIKSDSPVQLNLGLVQALEVQKNDKQDIPKRRVIVYISNNENNLSNGVSWQELETKLSQQSVPVYCMAFKSAQSTANNNKLEKVASLSNGHRFTITAKNHSDIVLLMQQKVRDCLVVRLDCHKAVEKQGIQELKIVYTEAGKELEDKFKLDIKNADVSNNNDNNVKSPGKKGLTTRDQSSLLSSIWKSKSYIGGGILGVLMILAAGFLVFRRRSPLILQEMDVIQDDDTDLRIEVVPGNAQSIGSRKEQQDSFGFSDLYDNKLSSRAGILAVLADGMGGLSKGWETSDLAVNTFISEYNAGRLQETIPQSLQRALEAANLAVNEMACQCGMQNQVGSTLVAAVVFNQWLYWISVGDSRIYLYRNKQLSQLTEDHVYLRKLMQQVEQGIISREDAMRHQERASLTSFLGLAELKEIDCNIRPIPLFPGDIVLLCSDGLHGVLSDQEIETLMEPDPQVTADRLLDKVLSKKRANQDNVTIAVIACIQCQ